jgi:hypothetical protein
MRAIVSASTSPSATAPSSKPTTHRRACTYTASAVAPARSAPFTFTSVSLSSAVFISRLSSSDLPRLSVVACAVSCVCETATILLCSAPYWFSSFANSGYTTRSSGSEISASYSARAFSSWVQVASIDFS